MKAVFGKIMWGVLIIGIGYGAYYAYMRFWDPVAIQKRAQNIENTVKNGVQTGTKKIVDNTKQQAQKNVQNYLKQKTGEIIQSLGDSLVSSASSLLGVATSSKKGIDIKTISPTGNPVLPAPKGEQFETPPAPATILTKINIPLAFSVNKKLTYAIDWGDTKKEDGTVTEDSMRLVSHIWNISGDYMVKMVIRDGSAVSTSLFPVRVYE